MYENQIFVQFSFEKWIWLQDYNLISLTDSEREAPLLPISSFFEKIISEISTN
jgi:hypothetical protein